jgi:hypothetical protein
LALGAGLPALALVEGAAEGAVDAAADGAVDAAADGAVDAAADGAVDAAADGAAEAVDPASFAAGSAGTAPPSEVVGVAVVAAPQPSAARARVRSAVVRIAAAYCYDGRPLSIRFACAAQVIRGGRVEASTCL